MTNQPNAIRSFFLDGPVGHLEALLNLGAENAPTPLWYAIPIHFTVEPSTIKLSSIP